MLVEQIDSDARLLADGEHVSGRAADEYRTRVEHAARFRGRVVNQIRNARRLVASIDPDIHHGDAMTCVYRADTAECRKALAAQGIEATDGPDEAHCRSSCVNLAYTDRDIARLATRAGEFDTVAANTLAPQLLRERASALADQPRSVIDNHAVAADHDRLPGVSR